jgi:hypothetical protein
MQGGFAARPALEAVLGKAHFVGTPVLIDGENRWQLTARTSTGYLLGMAGDDPSNVVTGQGRPMTPSARLDATKRSPVARAPILHVPTAPSPQSRRHAPPSASFRFGATMNATPIDRK